MLLGSSATCIEFQGDSLDWLIALFLDIGNLNTRLLCIFGAACCCFPISCVIASLFDMETSIKNILFICLYQVITTTWYRFCAAWICFTIQGDDKVLISVHVYFWVSDYYSGSCPISIKWWPICLLVSNHFSDLCHHLQFATYQGVGWLGQHYNSTIIKVVEDAQHWYRCLHW